MKYLTLIFAHVGQSRPFPSWSASNCVSWSYTFKPWVAAVCGRYRVIGSFWYKPVIKQRIRFSTICNYIFFLLFGQKYKIWNTVYRSLELDNSFSRIAIRSIELEMCNSREQIAIRESGLSNSRKQITNPWERITNPWERIAQFDITIYSWLFFWKSPCPFRAFGTGYEKFVSGIYKIKTVYVTSRKLNIDLISNYLLGYKSTIDTLKNLTLREI